MKEKYYVYILRSKKDISVYIGCTKNLSKRLKEHNLGLSVYTKSKRPWDLLWYAAFSEKKKAYEFETYLKTSSGKAFASKRFL